MSIPATGDACSFVQCIPPVAAAAMIVLAVCIALIVAERIYGKGRSTGS